VEEGEEERVRAELDLGDALSEELKWELRRDCLSQCMLVAGKL
jgi:hypothetical protein